ncbi:FAD-binding oxidoreductase [bacterium]|nr:FAD-binding oxidoreductase [bacterium]MBU1991171.1 FAD-binding oxidoreductase [bacterium]
MYDLAIIGAGINGCSVAYEMSNAKKSVILFDMEGVASGGSGAAGAFISPKFSKSGELKELIHDAFLYSMDFYDTHFSHLLTKTPLLHIAKDEEDGKILKHYKEHTSIQLKTPSDTLLDKLTPLAKKQESISMDAGVVDAQAMCRAMCAGTKFVKEKIQSLVYDDGMWIINDAYAAKEVVLATGAYEQLIKEPYMQLRGVWGHRIDVRTTTDNPSSIHQFVSISPSKDGVLAIGATHNVHYHPQTAAQAYDIDEGRAELLEKAGRTLDLQNIEVLRDYTGLRSGSFDYMPLLGPLVLSKETLACGNIRFKVKNPDYDAYTYYPNLYMINGNGGYGFVLAPYLAKILREYIVSGQKINERLSPARFFARWAKKL